jgi:DNA (cytosine-5)-methyltransferase 1
MNFIDLFAGCGGLSEGFLDKGFEPIFIADIDKDAMLTSANRLKDLKFKGEDISKICHTLDLNVKEVPKQFKEIKFPKIDVLLAGIPCQAFSTVGRAQDKFSMKFDERNYLYKSLLMYVNFFKPNIVLIENVSGLFTAKPKDNYIISEIFDELENLGYDVHRDRKDILLNSAEYGVPQIRKRIIICGIKKKLNIKGEKFFSNLRKTHYLPNEEAGNKNLDKYVTVRDAVSDLPKLKPGEGIEKIDNFNPTLNRYTKLIRKKGFRYLYNHVARRHNEHDIERYTLLAKNNWQLKDLVKDYPELVHHDPKHFGNRYTVQNYDYPGKTIVSHLYKDGNLFIHPDSKQHRTFTVREAARIQSFPDDFKFCGSRTQQYKQIGNAVPAMLSLALAKSVVSLL